MKEIGKISLLLEFVQQYAREKLDIAKASSEELEFFMRVYEKIIDKYTQTLREEDASCKDLVLKIATKSKLIDIKTDLDTALEELNGIKTEKSNSQEIHDLLTKTLQEEHYLISRVSDYSFGKILPTLDAYSVIFGTEKNLLDSVNLSKLPSLSKHFSIDPEQLRADIDKTFADMKKVAGIDTQVDALKCGCIAMNNALTGDGQNAAQYLGDSLKSHVDRCVSGADKFLSAGFEPLLKDMHDKNFYRDKAPDFLSFNKLMCSIHNDNLHNEPHISAPQTVSLPDPIPAPPIPNPTDGLPPIHVEL
ncbi:hypothetical protein [Wolbachia endosymbiont (group E) of Neria commutata]|uniref:hypothetical protein n=1 Tax=Wolbachia endosymbiont (group E) of Neria commutata TaxID=3066149 RepID=UPI00313335FE